MKLVLIVLNFKRDINLVYSKEILDTPRESPWGKTTREQKEGLGLLKSSMMKSMIIVLIKILIGLLQLGI